jgi:hypothetical protein
MGAQGASQQGSSTSAASSTAGGLSVLSFFKQQGAIEGWAAQCNEGAGVGWGGRFLTRVATYFMATGH